VGRGIVAALEAALVAVGLPRAEEMANVTGGSDRALALQRLLLDHEATGATLRALDTGLALTAGSCALAAGWGLSWLGVPLSPVLVVAAGLLSLCVTAAARALGASHGEGVGLALGTPIYALRPLLAPLGSLLAWMVAPLAGGRGRFSMPRPPLEEMERWLQERARAPGERAADSTSELIHRVFQFREKVARDVMVPRTKVVAVDVATPTPEIIRLLSEEGHSRMPVYRESLDHIVGTLHARDLVPMLSHPELIVLRDLIRPAHFVPWSKPVDQLLREMQRKKLHMAVVVDEYGGVMGVCTLEDVLEEIVGEIRDEFEPDEGRNIEVHADGSMLVRGATGVAEFNKAAGTAIPEDQGYETVAGFLNSLAGAIPNAGDRFSWRGWTFTVSERNPRRVTRVRAARARRVSSSSAT
jgi:CBS domain containing-hemolysin-like protein